VQCAGVLGRGGAEEKTEGQAENGGENLTLYHKDKSTEVHNGDCLEVLRTLPDNSVDACVTDPPYGLAFMGKKWDYDVPSSEVWQEVLRVLKPGGHLLAFAGTRTQHRMAVRIEDEGFEIRDMIAWVYGSGFPKSLDVSKAIDSQDAVKEQQERRYRFTAWVRSTGVTSKQIDDATQTKMGNHYTTHPSQPAIMTREHLEACRHLFQSIPKWVEAEADIRSIESQTLKNREVVGEKLMVDTRKARAGFAGSAHSPEYDGSKRAVNITAPATEAAKQWQGWGTALKPALEPITMARAPLSGSVAANVLEHGTGAVNVDGCRVGDEGGRFPANLIHDGSDEVTGLFPESNGQQGQVTGKEPSSKVNNVYGDFDGRPPTAPRGDSGSASRFFYCAKADASERRNSKHPTVKPVALMRYLVRLVCPAGGVVLDPFAGSGTTIEAARLEHCRAIGIERELEYCADILERLRQGVLF
jgi:DNA modification methylase